MRDLPELDMQEELFIGPYETVKANIPPEPREYYVEALRSDGRLLDVVVALEALTGLSRTQRALRNGRFPREDSDQFINDLRLLVSTKHENLAGCQLVAEGAYCEGTGDFVGAARLYRAAIDFKITDRKAAYYRFNNLGFCLNYLRCFEEALEYLEQAIAQEPKAYNAFKNIGVAYEHLGKTDLAAKSYMHAINYSNAEQRCLKHFLRLVARNPALKSDKIVESYLRSLKEHGKI
jgi:tetratricopeptide (TPR) repeat protein